MKKVFCVVFSLLLVLNTTSMFSYADNQNVTSVEIDVLSSENGYETINAYYIDNLCYFRVSDIAKYTRSKYTLNYDGVTFNHGTREVSINCSTKTLTEDNIKADISVIQHNELMLIHAYPMLTYLGATCDVENNKFIINMPATTMWEGLERTEEEQYITLDIFGEKTERGARLFLNGLISIMESGISSAIFENPLRDTFSLAMQVNLSNYQSCNNLKFEMDKKYDSLTESMIAASDFSPNIGVAYDDVANPINNIVLEYFGKVFTDDYEFNEKITGTKWGLGTTGNIISILSAVSERSRYTEDSAEMLLSFSNNTTKNSPYYYAAADLYNKTASDIIFARDLAAEMILEKVVDKTVDTLAGTFTLFESSVQIGVLVNKLMYGEHNTVICSSTETFTINLLMLKEVLLDDMFRLGSVIINENYSNEQHLEDYRLLNVLYYRVLLALNEQFEAYIVAQDREDEMQDIIENIRINSNLFAKKLYILTISNAEAFPDLNGLSKTNPWDVLYKAESDTTEETTSSSKREATDNEIDYTSSNSLEMYHLSLMCGQYAISGSYKYYIESYGLDEDMEPVGGLFKKNIETGEKTLLKDNVTAQNIQVVGNKIFYTLCGGGPYNVGIHMISTDGTGYSQLYDGDIHCFVADEHNVYFAVNDPSCSIRKISYSDSSYTQTVLTQFNGIISDMNLISGGVIYADENNVSGNKEIVIYNIATKSKTFLNEEIKELKDFEELWVNDSYIYILKWKLPNDGYYNGSDTKTLMLTMERELVRYNIFKGNWECCELPIAEYHSDVVVGSTYYMGDIYSGVLSDFEKELPNNFKETNKYSFEKTAY